MEGEHPMKKFGVGLLALMFTFAAYAAKNSKTVDFGQAVQIGSTKVPAGPVKVTWTGTGSAAQLTLTPRGQKPITVPAQIVAQGNPWNAIATINVNGVQYLQEVDLSHLTLKLRTAPTATAQAGN
jgi:hypothetical protein